MNNDLLLGQLLGRREAFSTIAARCSAAEAAQLKGLRDSKTYLAHADDWKGFCETVLHISDDKANRLIGLLDRFGSAYFKVAQLTRISPETYRMIAPSIRDEVLYHNGEMIPLTVENSQRVAAAVAEIRKSAGPRQLPAPQQRELAPPPPPDPTPLERIDALEKEAYDMCRRIEKVISMRLDYREQLRAVVCGVRDRLNSLEQMV